MINEVSTARSFGGVQSVYEHPSEACDCVMRFAVYVPPAAQHGTVPVLTWLSGLTCTEDNFITKAGAQRIASKLGMMIVAPDTSPRGDGVPDDSDAWDFGQGAGFYVDATEAPWSQHFRMYSYVTDELQRVIAEHLPADMTRQGISGHSMGGHGALTLHFNNPHLYQSVSAFAPIVAPSQVPWGRKALSGYLGDDKTRWAPHDAVELVRTRPSAATILIDQGEADNFLKEQLRPELFAAACETSNQPLNLRLQSGYDHSYYFVASFIEDHLRHHWTALAN